MTVTGIQQRLLVRRQVGVGRGAVLGFHPLQLVGRDALNRHEIGHEDPHQHSPDQIPEHRHQQHSVHDPCGFDGDAVRPEEEIPVNDVDAHLGQDACQQGIGNLRYGAGLQENQKKKDKGMDHPGQRCSAAGLHIDDRAHGGASAWQTGEQARQAVANALADELTVG